ncbi:PqqD family protein, partial [Candidatus Margulisiibacteriota bacterium]
LLRIEPKIKPIVLSDEVLQPSKNIYPTKIKFNNQLLIKPNNIIYGISENQSKVFNVYSRKSYVLTGTSDKIWKSLNKKLTKNEIIDSLLAKYNVKRAELDSDINDFINLLVKENLLVSYDNKREKKSARV